MNNKWVQLVIAILLWIFFTKNVIANEGTLNGIFNDIAYSIFPETVVGFSGNLVMLTICSIIYFTLAYVALFHTKSEKTH